MNEPQSLEADNTNVIRLSGSVFLDTFVGNLHQHGIHTALYHAALLGISRTELCACVQTLTGMNYSDFTDNYILLMANDILKDKKIDRSAPISTKRPFSILNYKQMKMAV